VRGLRHVCVTEDPPGADGEPCVLLQLDFLACEVPFRVHLRFEGMRSFKLTDFNGSRDRISGFSIKGISDRQWEDLNWHIWDYEDGDLEFYARTAELTAVDRLPVRRREN